LCEPSVFGHPIGEQRGDRFQQLAIAGSERGTTISDFVSMLHARYRESAFTSSTTMVVFSAAAAPQIPRPSGIRVCGDGLPTYGPSTSSLPSRR
jgi:hypothetical protein